MRDELGAIERFVGANLVFGVYDLGGTPATHGFRPSDVPDVLNTDRYVVDRAGNPTRNATMFAGWARRDALAGGGVPLHPTLRTYLLLQAKVYVFCPPAQRAEVEACARAAISRLYLERREEWDTLAAPRRAAAATGPRRRAGALRGR